MMETMRIQAVKLSPEFYCTKKGVCDRMYTCINPTELLNPVCPYLLVKSPSRKLHETISLERKKEAEEPMSGYFIRIGTENKDLITECTAQEFRDWMRKNGLNIDFMSDRTLDAEDLKFRHEIRRAFLLDLKARKEAEV